MTTTKWTLDPTHSVLGFKIKHLMITNVSGSFKDFQTEVQTQGHDFSTAQINVTADMSSITTNNEQRDAHLLTSDFFEVEKHPQLSFKSTRIEKIDDDTLALHGDLTLKGITKSVRLNVEVNGVAKDPWGGERAGFVVSGKIKRSEWGVTFNAALETGGVMLGEDVTITGEIQLIKQAAAIAA
jgi:polyisoprenoid-binding protein YceI